MGGIKSWISLYTKAQHIFCKGIRSAFKKIEKFQGQKPLINLNEIKNVVAKFVSSGLILECKYHIQNY